MFTRSDRLGPGAILWMAISCFCWFGYQWYVSHDSLKWPAQTAQISEVKIERNRQTRGRYTYSARVFYHFVHDHVSYEGSEELATAGSVQEAQQSASMWKHGERLQIHYNPQNPQQSCLHQGERLNVDGFIALGALLIIGLVVLSQGMPLAGSAATNR